MGARVWRREDAANTASTSAASSQQQQPQQQPAQHHPHSKSQPAPPPAKPQTAGEPTNGGQPRPTAGQGLRPDAAEFQPKPPAQVQRRLNAQGRAHLAASTPPQATAAAGNTRHTAPNQSTDKPASTHTQHTAGPSRSHPAPSAAPAQTSHALRPSVPAQHAPSAAGSSHTRPSTSSTHPVPQHRPKRPHAALDSEQTAHSTHPYAKKSRPTQDAGGAGTFGQPPSQDKAGSDSKAELASKEAELAALRARLEKAEAAARKRREKEAAEEAARAAARQQQEQQQQAAQRRREQLAKGFGSIASAAPIMPAAGGSPRAGTPPLARAAPAAATEWDVARVLDSKTDYDCLRLPTNATLAQVKRSYRDLAMVLHPDKCKLEGAGAAFQRLSQSYNRLCSLLGS